jgi:phenylalanyl-tRNA synthetase beta chain
MEDKPVKFEPNRVQKLLGVSVSTKDQFRLIKLIGSQAELKNDKITAQAPSWRFDLEFWEDYAEEIVRFLGINDGIPAKHLAKPENSLEQSSELAWSEGVKDRLVELGFNEIMSYSFIGKDDLAMFQLHKVGELANPLNPQLKFLRPSLLPNIAMAIGRNAFFEPILLFEIGHVFTLKSEQIRLGIAIANQKDSIETWIARIADAFGLDSLDLESGLLVTKLDNVVAQHYKIRRLPAYILEISLDKLKAARRIPHQFRIPTGVAKYKTISKYPPITRDLAIVVPIEISNQDISEHIAKSHPFVEYVSIFDEFTSSKLGENMKSIAFHILYSSPNQTLNQFEVEEIEKELILSLQNSFTATTR